MKQLLPIIGTLFGTLFLALSINLILVIARPESFGTAASASGSVDSLGTTADSLSHAVQDSISAGADSTVRAASNDQMISGYVDSIAVLREQLAFAIARAEDQEVKAAAQQSAADSARIKNRKDFAKMIESMSAEDAARILQNLDDGEVRDVLATVKKRQAGKILGAMDARRAARMIN